MSSPTSDFTFLAWPIVSEADLDLATAALKEQTAQLQRRCRLLERQKALLTKHKASRETSQSTPKSSQVTLEAQQLSATLHDNLIRTLQRTTKSQDDLPDLVSRILSKDDRTFDVLQKQTSRLEVDDSVQKSLDSVDMLCKNYARQETRAVAIRIDQGYRDALKSYPGSPTTGDAASLKIELQELHGEVEGLVKLIGEHYYGAFIRQGLQRSHSNAVDEAARWSEYHASVLLYLTARLEALDELVRHTHRHKSAVTALQQELSMAVKERPRPERPKMAAVTTSAAGLKPLRLVQTSLKRDQDQTAPLLRLLGIDEALSADDADQFLAEHLKRRLDASNAAQTDAGTEDSTRIDAYLRKAEEHAAELLSAVRACIKSGKPTILDDMHDLEALEARIAETAQVMQELSLEELSSRLRDIV